MSHSVLQFLRRVADDQRTRAASDAELLRRLVETQDQASFDTLLRRHGPMVHDVCRSVLPGAADADDAFQATFLVLARKAGSVRKAASLGSWLHGVAYRIALRARAEAAKRQKFEAKARKPEAVAPGDLTWGEVRRVLHEELSRLAERYRGPLTLCYLQGRTLDAAARELRVPKGTLKRRLQRGRALLRVRLVRRGLGPAALLLAAWPAATASAALPAAADAIARARSLFPPAGTATASFPPLVQCLGESTLRELFLAKVKAALAAGVAAVILGLAGGLLAWKSQAGDTPPPAAGPPQTRPQAGEGAALDRVVRGFAERLQRQPVRQPDREDRLGLFLMGLARRDTTSIAGEVEDGRAYCGSPCWSRDGRRILFDATPGKQFDQTSLQAFDADGRGVRRTNLGPGNSPTLSPDGKQVAFHLNPDAVPGQDAGVYVMNADGGGRRRLGDARGIPKWSPDGRHLLVAGFASPTPVSLLDVTTGEERALALPDHRIYSVPSWAAPGTVIAVVSSKAGAAIALVDVTDPAAPSVKETLWRSADGPAVDPAYPVYSPVTKCCVFVGREKDRQALYVLTPGKAPERLEPGRNDGRIASLAFSPDGRYLLFCSDRR